MKFLLHNFWARKRSKRENRKLINRKLVGKEIDDGQAERETFANLSNRSTQQISKFSSSNTKPHLLPEFAKFRRRQSRWCPVGGWVVIKKNSFGVNSINFTYAIHLEDDLRVLNAEITNYDTWQVSTLRNDTLRRRDEAVQAFHEGYLADDVVMDFDVLAA